MPEKEDPQKRIYQTFSTVATSLGYSDVHGMIIASLVVADKPLCLQDLSKNTGYSLSSISVSLDLLELVGMVRKSKNLGDKKVYATLEGDIIDGVRKAFIFKIQKEINKTMAEFERHKGSNDPKTQRMISKLEKEVIRLREYLDELSKVPVPKSVEK